MRAKLQLAEYGDTQLSLVDSALNGDIRQSHSGNTKPEGYDAAGR